MRRGFTLIELLIVVGIIGVLVAITLVVGGQVLAGGKSRTTQDILRQLSTATDLWAQQADSKIPSKYTFSTGPGAGERWEYALADVREQAPPPDGAIAPAIDSGARAMALLRSRPDVAAALSTLPSKFVVAVDLRARDAGGTVAGNEPSEAVNSVQVLDAWGRPIRFVHPAWDGGWGEYWNGSTVTARDNPYAALPAGQRPSEIRGGTEVARTTWRRSYKPFSPQAPGVTDAWVGDADEGRCESGAPYWYSVGEDGDPGERGDNVYTTRPRFDRATEALGGAR